MSSDRRPPARPPRPTYNSDKDRRDRDRVYRRDRSGSRERPASRTEDSRRPARVPSNPILAEAQRLAREKRAAEERVRMPAGMPASTSGDTPPRRAAWRSPSPEGEPDAGTRSPPAKRKHSPIVWQGATTAGPVSLAPRSAPGSAASAASIAQAEVEAFAERQAAASGLEEASGVSEFFFKPSPSLSSPEEAAHIRREGSPHPAQPSMLESDAEGPAAGRGRWGEAPPVPGRAAGAERMVGRAGGGPASELDPASPGAGPEGGDPASSGAAASGPGADPPPASPPGFRPGRPFLGRASAAECRSVDLYEKLNHISEGTYGVVYRARNSETGEICALKRVKLDKERDGFPLTALREINILLSLRHPNIVNVSEVVVGSSLDSVFMVMEYGDHDLAGVMRRRLRQPFSPAEAKTLMTALLAGVAYLHDNWVLHRDLKTSNILYTNQGVLKVCDFGLARQYGSPLKPYTHMVVTLWYRAPELLLGAKHYSTAVDVWSVGCIMAELLTREPLFPGKGEIDQLGKIFGLLGTPTEETWPGLDRLPNFRKFNFRQERKNTLRAAFPPPGPVFDGRPTLSEAGFDLLSSLLSLCPERRISAAEALQHPWFKEHPLPKDTALMPTFPSTAAAPSSRR
ncbi:CDKH1 [Auxenochlorella protothecoides x Auxenochlorella symbiontica]